MRFIRIQTFVPNGDPQGVFSVLASFERYPEHATTVRSVAVRDDPALGVVSDWEVDFRGGILRWVERDTFDRSRLRIEFDQVSGDIDLFSGYWRVDRYGDGCAVEFGSWFDLGIPTLDDVLDPIAEDAIRENIAAITAGLFGAGTRTLATHSEPATPQDVHTAPVAG